MKPRRVIITLDVETDAPLDVLRSADWAQFTGRSGDVAVNPLRVKASVVRPAPRKARRKP